MKKNRSAPTRWLSIRGQLSFTEQVGLLLPDVLWAQRVRRLMEVAGEILNGHEVRPHGTL